MYQIDVSSAAANLPASTAQGAPGYFTDGDLVAGKAPTVVPAEFLNALMLEVLNVVNGAGIAPSKASSNQLLLAVKALIAAAGVSSTVIATTGGQIALSATQAASSFIVVTGALTSNVVLVVPPGTQRWTVVNNTTGAYPLMVQTAAGSGVPVTQGRADTVVGDGVNVAYAVYDVGTRAFGDSSSAAASTLYVDRAVSQVGGYFQDYGATPNAYLAGPVTNDSSHPISIRVRTMRPNSGPVTINLGFGAVPLRTEQGADLSPGDVPTGSIMALTYDPSVGYALLNELVPSQLGQLARENIGQGLEDDGAGNLRIKLADAYGLRRTAAGLQANRATVVVPGGLSASDVAGGHGSTVICTGAAVPIAAPATSTLWNGFNFTVSAVGGAVTFTPNAADKVNGGAVGAAFTVLQGQSVVLVTDGAGNWWPLFPSTPTGTYSPKYINGAQTLGAGTYWIDTSAGAFTITLPAGPTKGSVLEFSDATGTWDTNALTLARNGSTILGAASDLVCDVGGETLKIWFDGSDWKVF